VVHFQYWLWSNDTVQDTEASQIGATHRARLKGTLRDKVFRAFIVPFRIQKLDIAMPYHELMNLPPLDVDEFAVVVTDLQVDGDLKVPPFMDKTRHICVRESATVQEECEPKLKELCLSWHQLRSFECHSRRRNMDR